MICLTRNNRSTATIDQLFTSISRADTLGAASWDCHIKRSLVTQFQITAVETCDLIVQFYLFLLDGFASVTGRVGRFATIRESCVFVKHLTVVNSKWLDRPNSRAWWLNEACIKALLPVQYSNNQGPIIIQMEMYSYTLKKLAYYWMYSNYDLQNWAWTIIKF